MIKSFIKQVKKSSYLFLFVGLTVEGASIKKNRPIQHRHIKKEAANNIYLKYIGQGFVEVLFSIAIIGLLKHSYIVHKKKKAHPKPIPNLDKNKPISEVVLPQKNTADLNLDGDKSADNDRSPIKQEENKPNLLKSKRELDQEISKLLKKIKINNDQEGHFGSTLYYYYKEKAPNNPVTVLTYFKNGLLKDKNLSMHEKLTHFVNEFSNTLRPEVVGENKIQIMTKKFELYFCYEFLSLIGKETDSIEKYLKNAEIEKSYLETLRKKIKTLRSEIIIIMKEKKDIDKEKDELSKEKNEENKQTIESLIDQKKEDLKILESKIRVKELKISILGLNHQKTRKEKLQTQINAMMSPYKKHPITEKDNNFVIKAWFLALFRVFNDKEESIKRALRRFSNYYQLELYIKDPKKPTKYKKFETNLLRFAEIFKNNRDTIEQGIIKLPKYYNTRAFDPLDTEVEEPDYCDAEASIIKDKKRPDLKIVKPKEPVHTKIKLENVFLIETKYITTGGCCIYRDDDAERLIHMTNHVLEQCFSNANPIKLSSEYSNFGSIDYKSYLKQVLKNTSHEKDHQKKFELLIMNQSKLEYHHVYLDRIKLIDHDDTLKMYINDEKKSYKIIDTESITAIYMQYKGMEDIPLNDMIE